MVEGYPQFIIFLVLGIGLLLAILRPYTAFLFAVLLLTAANVAMFNKTRTEWLGPVFNLSDACLLIALIAMLVDRSRSKKPILLPRIIIILFFVVTIAGLQSLWKLGWTYETIRAYRWALQLPLTFLLGANLVTGSQRARKLVAVLLCGAVLAAVQHLLFVSNVWQTKSLNMQTYELMRTISYWGGCLASAFLLSAVVWKLPTTLVRKALYFFVGILFLATLFLNQTRSIWLATIASIPFLLVVLKIRYPIRRLIRIVVLTCIMVVAFAWACQYLIPGLDVFGVVDERAYTLLSKESHMGTRERSFSAEMTSWMDGTLIFGQGLDFMQTVKNSEDPSRRIAFGHLGYVTYLSQLGLIGLLAYGIYLPLSIIKDSRWLWFYGGEPIIRYVGLLGTASIICLSIMFIMSSQLLSPSYSAPGILYGAMWALVRQCKIGL